MKENIKIGKNPNINNLKLGAWVREKGVLFSIFSRNARNVWIVLFKNIDGKKPDFTFELTKEANRIGDIWYVFVEGISEGWYYLWKMDGPFEPDAGLIFNKEALLLDLEHQEDLGRTPAREDQAQRHLAAERGKRRGYVAPGVDAESVAESMRAQIRGDVVGQFREEEERLGLVFHRVGATVVHRR